MSTVKVAGKSVAIDPQVFFQRLITLRERYEDAASLFQYELCSYPSALFESCLLPHEPKQSVLLETFWRAVGKQQKLSRKVQYVLDGDALLHRVPWPRDSTFESMSQMYVRYVTTRCGGGGTASVLDAYSDDPTTKDDTHMRRTWQCTGVTVYFTGGMMIQSKKDEFLNNKVNK